MVEAIRQGDIPGVQLRCRQRLEVSAESGWRWLSESALAMTWLADRVDGDFAMGGRLDLSSHSDATGEVLEESGEVVALQHAQQCVLYFKQAHPKWDALTKVTLELFPQENGSEISIFHEGFEYLSLSECLTFWEFYRRRWRSALTRLAKAVNP